MQMDFVRRKAIAAFPAFQSKNYRLYFAGQLVSLVGTWMQTVAQGWLVLQITNSAFYVGLIAALNLLPVFFFSLFAGVMVDRFSKKELILYTESFAMGLALLLGILTITDKATLPIIAIMAFLLGVVNAIDMPARQSFTVEMVGKENLHSAIALNSGTYNAARAIGPAIAGIAISIIGIGGAFIANGLSFLAVLLALIAMKIPKQVQQKQQTLDALKEGILYSLSHRLLKTYLVLTALVGIFGWSYVAIMPVVARDVFKTDASGLGILHTAAGLGALSATVIVSSMAKKIAALQFIIVGSLLYALTMLLFTLTTHLYTGLLFLYLAGMGLIFFFTMINTSIQRFVPDSIRGRVMSIYIFMFVGMTPFGNFEIGLLSQYFGPMAAIRMNTLVVLLVAIYLFVKRKSLFNNES